jgi:hypothetical protein
MWVIKSRRVRWAEYVARTREMTIGNKILVGKPERKIHLEHLGVDGRIISISMLINEV